MRYRNFEIRAEKMIRVPPHLQGLWRSYMRELPDGRETEISLIQDTEEDAIKCAKQCVDYQYRVEVWEFINGRKYRPIEDGCIQAFD